MHVFFSNYDKLEIDAAKSNTVPSQFVKTFNGNKNCFQELRGWRNGGRGGYRAVLSKRRVLRNSVRAFTIFIIYYTQCSRNCEFRVFCSI